MKNSEYCVKGETKDGKVLTVRRGFVSQEAAEEYPVQSSLWTRVWVEPWRLIGSPPAKGGHYSHRESIQSIHRAAC
jgi:hypothetical protein